MPVQTFLIVDDEPSMLESLSHMLELLGHPALQASSGAEAVALFKQHKQKICCLITDLKMPKMDGWETIAAIRAESPLIPVIVMSGYDMTKGPAQPDTNGPQAFLGKPFTLLQLRTALRFALA